MFAFKDVKSFLTSQLLHMTIAGAKWKYNVLPQCFVLLGLLLHKKINAFKQTCLVPHVCLFLNLPWTWKMHLYTCIAWHLRLCRAVLMTCVTAERLPTPTTLLLICLHSSSERRLILTLIQQIVESVIVLFILLYKMDRRRSGRGSNLCWDYTCGTGVWIPWQPAQPCLGLASQRWHLHCLSWPQETGQLGQP